MSEQVTTRYYCDRCRTELIGTDRESRGEAHVIATGRVTPDSRYPENARELHVDWKDLCPNCRIAVSTFFNPRGVQPKVSEINEARDFFQNLLDQRDEKDRPTFAANLTMSQAYWLLRRGYKI